MFCTSRLFYKPWSNTCSTDPTKVYQRRSWTRHFAQLYPILSGGIGVARGTSQLFRLLWLIIIFVIDHLFLWIGIFCGALSWLFESFWRHFTFYGYKKRSWARSHELWDRDNNLNAFIMYVHSRLTGHWSCRLLTVLSVVWSIYIHCCRQLYTVTSRVKTFLSVIGLQSRWVTVTFPRQLI